MPQGSGNRTESQLSAIEGTLEGPEWHEIFPGSWAKGLRVDLMMGL